MNANLMPWLQIYPRNIHNPIHLHKQNMTWICLFAHQGSHTKPIPLIQCKQLWACILGASLSWPKSFAANNSVHCKVFMYLSGNCVIVNALKTEADFPAWNYLRGCQFSRTDKVSPTFGFKLSHQSVHLNNVTFGLSFYTQFNWSAQRCHLEDQQWAQ